ncbi:MAG: hypothetical protein HOC74_37260 [Gemmatimonadetes bacterium]|nr:hypothetical protein [Gemmatimonadota bacterium]
MKRGLAFFLAAVLVVNLDAQPVRTFVLGDGVNRWESGGNGREPTVLRRKFGKLGKFVEDSTNAPGEAIEFRHRPGWISPLFFDEEENIASRVLEGEGSISVHNMFYNAEVGAQLESMVNGDHRAAFERKPTPFNTAIEVRNIWVTFDFGIPVGVHRIRFYPRNTVVETSLYPFHNDFLRGYEVWVNATETDLDAPDFLRERNLGNESPVVDIELMPQYVRLVKLRSLTNVPFEIDEFEIFGTGYMSRGTYLSDILDLEDRATVGALRWVENAVGDPLFSQLSVRVRTGLDDSPVLYQEILRDAQRKKIGEREVTSEAYYQLYVLDRAPLEEDAQNWSPWSTVENGGLINAPVPRRFAQVQLEFTGELFAAREVDRLAFDYLTPPIADTLRAEVFPRLAQAEEPASFRYAVQMRATGEVRGYDRLEVDTNVQVEEISAVRLNGEVLEFEVEEIRADGFALNFPLIRADGSVLEFSFDLPIFRFGTTFSGRVYNRVSGDVPQRLEPGNAASFGPDDIDELSNLFVAIPKRQLGKLVGEVVVERRVITPNGDGANDRFGIFFNLLQLVEPAPVSLELFDLAGRRVHTLFEEERGIGPVSREWDGRLESGELVLPGNYVWVLRVRADAFEERYSGVLAVVY